MRGPLPPFAVFSRFRRDVRAVAAVEFALIMPLMLLAYLGAVDVTQGLAADRKLSHLAGMLGDLVAQKEDTIALSEVQSYFDASPALMQPYAGTETKVRITVVTIGDDGAGTVSESVAGNGAVALESGETVEIPEDIGVLARNRYVVLSEAWYDYAPMFSFAFDADVPLYQRYFNIPRHLNDSFDIAGLD